MKNKIIHTQNFRESCIGYNTEALLISSEHLHVDFQTLLNHTQDFYKSGTNGYAKINLNTIKEIQYHENNSEFFLKYVSPKSLKLKRHHFRIDNANARGEFCASLAGDCFLINRTENVTAFARFKLNLLYAFLILLFTYALHYLSTEELTHSRKASVYLVAIITQFVNPTFILVAGSICALYFIYKILLDFLKPTKTIKFY